MPEQTITLTLPAEVYERLQAEPQHLSDLLQIELELLFAPERVDLADLARFSTAQLWALANRPLPDEVKRGFAWLDELERPLTPEEEQTQAKLIRIYDQYVLMWTKVLIELEQRGEDIQQRRLV